MSAVEKSTLLVIDDSPLDISVLTEILKAEHHVLGATSPEAALGVLHSGKLPDLIILDVMMPGIDGLELCRQIKTDPTTANIPVIFVTAKDAVEDETSGFASGAVDYVAKPVNPHLVRARVRTHLELKRIRESLEKQNETLKENARLREEMEHINRHDLKNPLMVILNIPDLISRQANITAEQKEWIAMIKNAARKMLEMINRSIDMCKMENGTYELHVAPTDTLSVGRQIATAYAEIAQGKGVMLDFDVHGLPASTADTFIINTEELLFYSMLSNLVRNAIEAAPTGSKVSLSFTDGDAGVIAIHNEGAIPEKIRHRFFEKFATAGKAGGTGLGAYSAKLISKTLGGTISVETSEKAGTTITVRLPLR
jgi:two-component system, sensor histidine kinase and response regulator